MLQARDGAAGTRIPRSHKLKSKLQRRLSEKSWRSQDINWFLGVDVSKHCLDGCLLSASGAIHRRRFANTLAGYKEMLGWCLLLAPLEQVHCCMESTGPYSHSVASYLASAKLLVSVENPRLIKAHGISERVQNKTDKVDATVIADYCRTKAPRTWSLMDPTLRELDLLGKRLTELEQAKRREQNRLEDGSLPSSIQDSIKRMVRLHDEEAEHLVQEIEKILSAKPELQAMMQALDREPGVGELTALRALCHFGWGVDGFASAQQAAAFAGYNPVLIESGTLKGRTRISKRGDPGIRSAMHMASLSAVEHSPRIKAFYEKLIAKGKTKMAALAACARKLLMILFGILKAHLRGQNPSYSAEKLRYRDLRGKQKLIEPKNRAKPLTI